MSEHNLKIDVQKVADAFMTIRSAMDILEEEFQKALIKESTNGNNVD